MWTWFEREVIDRGRLPLFLALLAFVVTFLITRLITRMIRSGRGPFRDRISSSGIHVHHAVPGVLILIVGAFAGISTDGDPWGTAIAALLVGAGTSLVLDEFALLLRLDDVYWSEEGRVSVEIVALAAACLGLAIVSANPFQVDEGETLAITIVTTVVVFGWHLLCIVVCVAKRKYRIAVLGAFVPMLALFSSLRLARPNSHWANRFYSDHKRERARRRSERYDKRFGDRLTWAFDFVGGHPDEQRDRGGVVLPSDASESPEPTESV
ncbi:hypothetical protein [Ilumatobacter nonamiensis]|uniref:hypothetical protein n=1 Tax=Ilumatobacter nonamiensis TaxID=467093 RepID=UPI0003465B4B|nr:hypothetical protein [Ilumatobacter nonamiensis]